MMNYKDLRNLAEKVIERLEPIIEGMPIRLNRNFAKRTDRYTNGWNVQIGWVDGWDKCRFEIWLDDIPGWNKMQFQYCVSFREKNIMERFLEQINHENMFGRVASLFKDSDEEQSKLDKKNYGKPTLELNPNTAGGWFFYTINDLSKNVNDALVERIVGFYVAIGRALSENQKSVPKPDDTDVYSAKENRKQVVTHLRRERNPYLSLLRKQQDKYQCQICEMKFQDVYGEIGKDFAEAHHIVPLTQLDGPQTVSVDDLITVCANCHRMLHKLQGGAEDIDELKDMLLMRYEVR
ncbi:HNH endonuclease [Desulfococcaceae bacterium HSG9]|nr:HNH endonuclease [Desulfococcaceae bacterium HSG9]